MSVLLEALKKAAAEKKKAMDTSRQSGMDVPIALGVPESIKQPSLKLLAEDVNSSLSENERSNRALQDEVKAGAALKFTLSDMPTPAIIEENSPSITAPAALAIALESPNSMLESTPIEPKHSTEYVEHKHDLSSDMADSLIHTETASLPTTLGVDANETDKDSFEWSMDALPGYSAASVDDSVPIQMNSILLNGNLTTAPKVRKTINSRWIVVLSVALTMILISLYALFYYQQQNVQLENSMHKYDLVKIQISLPKTKIIDKEVLENTVIKVNEPQNIINDTTLGATSDVNELPNPNIPKATVELPMSQNTSVSVGTKVTNNAHPEAKRSNAITTKQRLNSGKQVIHKPVLVQTNKEEVNLSEAYKAYQAGKFDLAQLKFSEVLSFNPRSITAMIGLGGIASINGQDYVALDYYQQALNIDPNSLAAHEAIANISSSISLNSEWNESLKNIAQIYPNSAKLQYALGNLYASKNDWLAAQKSYFNAYALDMNNPDFIVNLAISLDQLGKYSLAGQYYTQALALAGNHPVNFNVTEIKDRLISIRQFMAQEE